MSRRRSGVRWMTGSASQSCSQNSAVSSNARGWSLIRFNGIFPVLCISSMCTSPLSRETAQSLASPVGRSAVSPSYSSRSILLLGRLWDPFLSSSRPALSRKIQLVARAPRPSRTFHDTLALTSSWGKSFARTGLHNVE